MRFRIGFILLAGLAFMSTACGHRPLYQQSAQFRDGEFHNPVQPKQPGGREMLSMMGNGAMLNSTAWC